MVTGRPAAAETGVSVPAPSLRGQRGRILVVDDNPSKRYLTRRWLAAAGFDVIEAETGYEALERALEGPDLIVLDVRLPDLHGFEVLRRLKRQHVTAHIPVLQMSALLTSAEDRAAGLEQGADGYLTYPIEEPELTATVRALLRVRAAESELRASEERYRALIEQAPDAFFVAEPDGRITDVNSAASAMSGYTPEELIGAQVASVIAPEDLPRLARVREELATGRASVAEWTVVCRDGRRVPVEVSAKQLRDGRWQAFARDITERRRAESEREALARRVRSALGDAEHQREVAESASRAKSEFLAVMSHELRTPLNAIGGHAQLLEMGVHGPVTPQQLEALRRIERSQRHLLGLINDILNLARIESGRVDYHSSVLSLREVITDVSSMILPQLEARQMRYTVTVEPEDLRVVADRERLQQIVLNLLSNAVKFTPAGGSVTVTATTDAAPELVMICVRDTGRGIPANKLEKIFEPFVQVDATHTRPAEGVGLGLAISRDLARGMGGDLRAESEAGEGATLILTLPRATIDPDAV